MKIIVSIDTTNNKEIKVGLRLDEKEYMLQRAVEQRSSQAVLPMLEELLKEHNLSLRDINELEVNTGPGSFTGIRVGVSIANALAFLLKIPLNKKPRGELVEPVYS